MRDAYERTIRDNREKRRELSHSDARFLVAHAEKKRPTVEGYGSETVARRDRDDKDDERRSELLSLASDDAVAFVHVRFEVEADDAPVVYAYELQCDAEKDARGKGLGRFLMRCAPRSRGEHGGCERSVLTVLKENTGARAFYEKLGYVPDPDTPADASCAYVALAANAESARARSYIAVKNKRYEDTSYNIRQRILGNCFCPLTALTSLATFASRTNTKRSGRVRPAATMSPASSRAPSAAAPAAPAAAPFFFLSVCPNAKRARIAPIPNRSRNSARARVSAADASRRTPA